MQKLEIDQNDDIDDDDIDEEYLIKEAESGEDVLIGILKAINDSKYMAATWAFLCVLVGIYLSTSGYSTYGMMSDAPVTADNFKLIRPVLTPEKMEKIRLITKFAESEVQLPDSNAVRIRSFESVTKAGNVHPPSLFFHGVTFGLTHSNAHALEYTAQSTRSADDLLKSLESMHPQPTHVMPRMATHNKTGWSEAGFAVYFSYKDLQAQGKISADKQQPWKRVLQDVLEIAREYRQVYVTLWYPHAFGEETAGSLENKVLIQQIEPTRTGLNGIVSKGAVWMSAFNLRTPQQKPEFMYVKPWTEEELAEYNARRMRV